MVLLRCSEICRHCIYSRIVTLCSGNFIWYWKTSQTMEDFDGKQRKEILYIVTIEFTVLLENRMTRSFGMLFTECIMYQCWMYQCCLQNVQNVVYRNVSFNKKSTRAHTYHNETIIEFILMFSVLLWKTAWLFQTSSN